MAARLARVIDQVLNELHPGRGAHAAAVTLDSSLDRDLAFDSLGRMELIHRLERDFDVSLPEQAFAAAETPRDLLRFIVNARGRHAPAAVAELAHVALGSAETAPHTARTLIDVLDWHARNHPDRPHLQFYADDAKGKILTYRDLHAGASHVAAGLQACDLPRGANVAIMLPTCGDYFFSFFGVLLAGGVPVPIYPPARMNQVESHLRRHTGILHTALVDHLIVDEESKPVARLLRSHVPTLRAITTTAELRAATGAPVAIEVGPADTAFIQFTSGSTGNPKGVTLSHANLLANIRAMGEALSAGPTDVFVSWLPLYHDMGLIGAWLGSLYHATFLVVMPPLAFMARPQRWLQAIHRHRGTLSAAPNFAYGLCLRAIDDKDLAGLDLSSWRAACNGAEPVIADTIDQFCARFAPYGFRRTSMMPVYGLAECSVGLTFPPLERVPRIDLVARDPLTRLGRAEPAAPDDATALHVVACGRPLTGHEIRIVDNADRELPERREGRLQFCGPSATSGYFRNPEQTKRLFHGDWRDSEDLAYMAEGDVFLTGRIKDLIIRAGRNIFPAELEQAIGEIPGVWHNNVAIFASRDPVAATERLIVLAESRRHDPATLTALRERINALAADLIGGPPDEIVLAPPNTVLRTSSGKVRRAACRELYESGGIGKSRAAVWWQLTRLTLSAVPPLLARWSAEAAASAHSMLAWTILGLAALPLWLIPVLLPVPSWRWAVLRRNLRLLFRLCGIRLAVEGLAHLPAADQPVVLVANHASYLDSFALIAALPGPIAFVAKAELARSFATRWPLARMGCEFVDRFDPERGAEDAARLARVLAPGRPLLFFPEGTFTRRAGLLPFHLGAFQTAVARGALVVCVTIRGTRSILRGESAFLRQGAVTVTVDPPLPPTIGADPWAKAIRLRDAARARLLARCGEADLVHERAPLQALVGATPAQRG
ncbi:MAG: AMP-binding protein [Alphaproteobacteria bacterium]|nr:AMP-binding protein [Alphaproteobacteria bacterium]